MFLQLFGTRTWFQHDGDPADFNRNVRNHLDAVYSQHWIGRGGPGPWPPRSPDLTCLEFFFWGDIKTMAYQIPITSEKYLVARLSVAAGNLCDMSVDFTNVRQLMRRRCESCIAVDDHSFEQLL